MENVIEWLREARMAEGSKRRNNCRACACASGMAVQSLPFIHENVQAKEEGTRKDGE